MTEAPAVGTVVASENAPDKEEVKLSDKPLTFEDVEFVDGDYRGFKYMVPNHNITGRKTKIEVDEGVATAITRYGEQTMLKLMDGQILSRIRTKVKNGLPKGKKPQEMAVIVSDLMTKHPDFVLFTEADAMNWKPDIRELSPNQLFKKAKEAFSAASMEQDVEKKAKLFAEGQKLLLQMGAAMQG